MPYWSFVLLRSLFRHGRREEVRCLQHDLECGNVCEKCVQEFLAPLESKLAVAREALEKIERKCHTSRDPHDSIEGIIGRFKNIWKVAEDALGRMK